MSNKFDERHSALLRTIDPDIADFYSDWVRMRESDEFETAAHLLAHLAREILRGLKNRVPKGPDKKIYNDFIARFDRFSHRRKGGQTPRASQNEGLFTFNPETDSQTTLDVFINSP